MQYNNFYIEKNQYISQTDLENIRILYTPIIGMESVALYHYLLDEFNLTQNPRYEFSLDEVLNYLNCNIEILTDAKDKLEAVGLIRCFESPLFQNMIISLNKPLTIEQYQKSVLAKQLFKLIGEKKYEKIFFAQQLFTLNKDEYINTSKKYTDLFELKDNINLNFDKLHTEIEKSKNINANTNFGNILTPEQFIKQKTNQEPTIYHKKMIENLVNLGFLDEQINLFIDFSLKVNNQIVVNYVETIARDYATKNIMLTNDIKKELEITLEIKNYSKNKQNINNLY
ncbi:DnaD domain protein [Mycoplasma zalophi]|uniref:DnaD domain protein n=1 Tax=Mycoplasma zalophi TaxID=191287 RepID=A0ABS6DPY0_9MOLU|nr:DnaD domain protein [Mycoplasma zalophi]MBU4690798.1 DnaD domain protein [Mycoplasma zalophi]MBU4692386.1 DnaD domain protein [Mycoplasma zalophi]